MGGLEHLPQHAGDPGLVEAAEVRPLVLEGAVDELGAYLEACFRGSLRLLSTS